MKKQFKDEVAKVVDKYKYRAPHLTALIMWAHNPTFMSAGYGFEDNIPFIERNISLMFQDENPEAVADTTYQDIINLGAVYEQLHGHKLDPFYNTYDEILKYIYSEYSVQIFTQMHDFIEQSKDLRTPILINSLKGFLKKKNHLDYRPTSTEKIMEGLDFSVEDKDISVISKKSTDKTRTYSSRSLDLLVSIGLLYQMHYESSSGKTEGAFYLVPLHVPEFLSEYEVPRAERSTALESIEPVEMGVKVPNLKNYISQSFADEMQSRIIWWGQQGRAIRIFAELFGNACDLIYIVDRFIDYRTLGIIKEAILSSKLNRDVIVKLLTQEISYFDKTERTFKHILSAIPNLQVRRIVEDYDFKNPFHDRYILTEDAGFQIGISIKDLGGDRLSAISRLANDDKKSLLDFFNDMWNDIGIDFP